MLPFSMPPPPIIAAQSTIGGALGSYASNLTAAWSVSRDLLSSHTGDRYTTATGVNAVKDQTGAALDLVQSAAARQPTIGVGPSGIAVLDFDASNDRLEMSVGAPASRTNLYLIFAFRFNPGGHLYQQLIATSGGDFSVYNYTDGPGSALEIYMGTGPRIVLDHLNTNRWYTLEIMFDNSTLNARIDGSNSVTGPANNPMSNDGALQIGQDPDFGEVFDGQISEMAVWSSVPSQADRDAIQAIFATHVGI